MILTFDAWSHTPALAPWVWGLTLVAIALYGMAGWLSDVTPAPTTSSSFGRPPLVLWAGWGLHALLILIDVLSTGLHTARFGFAPVLSITVWLVLGVYGVESRFLPLPGARRALALCALACVVLVSIFPGEPLPHVAPWAPLHWVLGLASYGLFGAAVLHAVLLNRTERRLRQKAVALGSPGLPLLRLERLTFRFVLVGFGVLTAALLLGWWVAVPWRWDHKTVFSLLGWAVFAALLVGRQAFGWRGVQATRWLYVGAGMLLLGYVGSRFVLEVLLRRAIG